MKYFSLSEILTAVPIALLIGAVGAFLYKLALANFMCLSGILRINEYLKSRFNKKRFTFKMENYADFYNKKYGFILSETVGFLFFSVFGIVFSLTLYFLSDGIPRLYIFLFVFLGFFISSKLLERPFVFISFAVMRAVFGVLFNIIYVASYIPVKVYLKKKAGFKKKRTENIKQC